MDYHPDAICSQKELKTVYGISVCRMTLWRWEDAGSFPRRLKRGFRIFYRRTQVEAWLRGDLKPVTNI